MARMDKIFEAFVATCDEINKLQAAEEEAQKLKSAEFEESVDEKKFNRGTVVSAMAEKEMTSYEMERILKEVRTPEHAEAAVGLIKSNNYTSYDIARILKSM